MAVAARLVVVQGTSAPVVVTASVDTSQPNSFDVTLSVDGVPWLSPPPATGSVRLHLDGVWYVAADVAALSPLRSMRRTKVWTDTGTDPVFGPFTATRASFEAGPLNVSVVASVVRFEAAVAPRPPAVAVPRHRTHHTAAPPAVSAVAFELAFPQGVADSAGLPLPGAAAIKWRRVIEAYAAGLDFASASFPTFDAAAVATAAPELSHATWLQDQASNTEQLQMVTGAGLAGFSGGLLGGSPLALFNESAVEARFPTLVMSQTAHFRDAVQTRYDPVPHLPRGGSSALPPFADGALQCGPHGALTSIPRNTTFRTVAVAGSGIAHTMDAWGASLLACYGKTPDLSASPSATHLTYYTDNGAYLYYNKPSNLSWAQTLASARDTHKAAGLPFAAYQLDSYWYPKSSPPDSGMISWTPGLDVAPDGMHALQQGVGTPLVAHSRWLSPLTTYANDPARYGVIEVTVNGSAPLDPAKFFNAIIGDAHSQWGLGLYEQDWMLRCMLASPGLLTTFGRARAWQLGMGDAALANGVFVAYGTGVPADVLQSVEVQTAAFVFAAQNPACPSVDCRLSWQVGGTGLFVRALGMLPFKDTFWSSPTQPGNRWNATFGNNALHALASVLSGPVGPGDKPGLENVTLLMATARGDGVLMAPDRPAVAVDASLSRDWPGGECWVAHTVLSPLQHFELGDDVTVGADDGAQLASAYVLAAGMRGEAELSLSDMHLDVQSPGATQFVAVDSMAVVGFRRRTAVAAGVRIALVNASSPLSVKRQLAKMRAGRAPPAASPEVPFALTTVAPVLTTGGSTSLWAVLGDTSTFVGTSASRVTGAQVTSNGSLVLTASCATDETFPLSVVTSIDAAASTATVITASCAATGSAVRLTCAASASTAGEAHVEPFCSCA